MKRHSPSGPLLITALLIIALDACAIVTLPIPWWHGSVRSGAVAPETATEPLRVGETRRVEVLGQLGPPARRFEELRIDAYGWTDVSWYFPWLFVMYFPPVQGMGLAERWQRHIVLVRYDSDDRVERVGGQVCGGNETIGECVRQWVEEAGPEIRQTSTESNTIVFLCNPAKWRWGIIATGVDVRIDGELVAELPPRTWTAVRTRPGVRGITLRSRDEPPTVGGAGEWAVGSQPQPRPPDDDCKEEESFEMRLEAGFSYEIEVGSDQTPPRTCRAVRWTARTRAEGIDARSALRRVW